MTAAARQQVIEAFRWILGRAPDPVALEDYAQALASGSATPNQLRDVLIASPEFRERKLEAVQLTSGVTVVVDPAEPEFGQTIAVHRDWEPHVGHVLAAELKPGNVYLDVGANVGVMAFQAARLVGPQGRVIAVEPSPANADLFRRSMLANGLDTVRLHQIAASDRFQMLALGQNSNAKVQAANAPLAADHIVQAERLDDVLAHEPRIDFIKMDIEGFELPALKGLTETFARHRPKLLCEFNPLCSEPLGFSSQAVADHLFSLGGRMEIIDHDVDRLVVGSAEALLDIWRRRDAEVSAAGLLPPGWLHFDLLITP